MLLIYILVYSYIYRPTRHVLRAQWKASLGISDPRPSQNVPTIATTSRNFGRQSDLNSDTQNKMSKTRLFMHSITTNNV